MSHATLGSSAQERYVFVYGTLRRGGSNDINLRQPTPRYVGSASLKGALFDLGPYPGLVLDSPALPVAVEVKGEVYAISAALEENLDELEGLLPTPSGEYFKRFMLIRVPAPVAAAVAPADNFSPQNLLCIVYEINPVRTLACALVQSGDWIAHAAQKQPSLAGALPHQS